MFLVVFFFNDTATTEIYTLSLHDALPIYSPTFYKDFDSELELRLGVLGNVIEKDGWVLDYELSADAKQADGPSVQSGLRRETEVDFFRAWLRLDNGKFKIRGGRQKILFGSGTIYRPLGLFDTQSGRAHV